MVLCVGKLSESGQQERFNVTATVPLGGLLMAGAGQGKNIEDVPQGDINKNSNDAKYSSLPLSLVPPSVVDQGNLDAYISNPASRQPTKKAFSSDQAFLVTTTLLTSSTASATRISMYTNKRSALASLAKGWFQFPACHFEQGAAVLQIPTSTSWKEVFDTTLDKLHLKREDEKASRRSLGAPLEEVMKEEEEAYTAKEVTHFGLISVFAGMESRGGMEINSRSPPANGNKCSAAEPKAR